MARPIFWVLILMAQLPMLMVYLIRLQGDPLYAWWSGGVAVVIGVLFLRRWDRQANWPRSRLSWVLSGFGMFFPLLAAWTMQDTWAVWGAICVCLALAASHADRNVGLRLALSCYPLLGLIQLPWGWHNWVTESLATLVERSIGNVLRLLTVPHIHFFGSFETQAATVYPDQAVFALASWPAFVTLSLVYSAALGRRPGLTLLNAITGVFWWAIFQCGWQLVLIMNSLPQSSWVSWGVALGMFALVSILFLSTEMAWRVLLMPIPESAFSSRLVNPFIWFWNSCVGASKRKSKATTALPSITRSAMVSVLALVAVTLIAQLVQAPRAWAAQRSVSTINLDRQQLEGFVFALGEPFNYRRSYRIPSLLGQRDVQVWTVDALLLNAEYILANHSQPICDLTSLIDTDTWHIESSEVVPNKIKNGPELEFGRVTLRRGQQHFQLLYAWLGEDGAPRKLVPDSDNGYLLISRGELIDTCDIAAKGNMVRLFSRFLVGVQTQLSQVGAAP